MQEKDAEQIAIAALGFIATDPELLNRFLAITGIQVANIRGAASEPGFMAGVLGFVLAHEPTLLAFAAHADIRPERVGEALRALPGGDGRYDGSI